MTSPILTDNADAAPSDTVAALDSVKRTRLPTEVNDSVAVIDVTPTSTNTAPQTKKAKKMPGRKEFVPRGELTPREPPFEGWVRRPKRKVALVMSYNGKGYHGMQINKTVPTIENELFSAFVSANAVGKENIDDPHKFGFMRAARTDKGVHAAMQVVSLKMCIEEPDIVAKMNEALPPTIRVWGYHRTRNSFHAKKQTDSRFYEYLMPTHTLLPSSELWEANKGTARTDDPQFHYNKDVSAEEHEMLKAYRISDIMLDNVKAFVQSYAGVHRFHNFTSNSTFKDPKAVRNMLSLEVVGPTVQPSGYEWIKVVIHGNSFMLHQIRKMMGLMIITLRRGKTFSDVAHVFGDEKANIPTAPPAGLLLRKTVHDGYNRIAEPDVKLDFEKYEEQIAAFAEEHIYKEIYEEVERTADFHTWNRSVDSRSFYYRALFDNSETPAVIVDDCEDNADGNASD